MSNKAGQIGQLVRTLGSQLKDAFKDALGGDAKVKEVLGHRASIVAKVSRNAVAELVNQARAHPQRGDPLSANPAYVALAELTSITGIPGLALGLRNETGEISFMDLDMDPEKALEEGGSHLERARARNLWRQLKHLVTIKVDRTMSGPAKPLLSPEDFPDEPDDSENPAEGETPAGEETVDKNDN
ncbi:MAG: hypothetical protein LBF41_02285 [Deltaproteobacteria bacterium]|nr:hypothetical protein [Deltaproteobacteria bacterium]